MLNADLQNLYIHKYFLLYRVVMMMVVVEQVLPVPFDS